MPVRHLQQENYRRGVSPPRAPVILLESIGDSPRSACDVYPSGTSNDGTEGAESARPSRWPFSGCIKGPTLATARRVGEQSPTDQIVGTLPHLGWGRATRTNSPWRTHHLHAQGVPAGPLPSDLPGDRMTAQAEPERSPDAGPAPRRRPVRGCPIPGGACSQGVKGQEETVCW